MKKFALIFAAGLWAMPALAGTQTAWLGLPSAQPADTLMPDRSGFSGDLAGATERDYAAILMSAFRSAFARDVRARVIIIAPLNGDEYSIAVKQRGGRFRIVAEQSTQSLWRYTASGRAQAAQLKQRLEPASYRDVPIERCSVSVDAKLGNDLVAVWHAMLTQADNRSWYDAPAEDAQLYFSSAVGNRVLAGRTSTSFQGEKVDTLIRIADSLNQYCLHKSRRFVTDLRTEVGSLMPTLKTEK
ncbi:MAG: hypothetical protein KGI68_14120 [Alphaproteobacteria bacterium]|nr:hypothetical protein [Alphaproteobacteria bacterium]